MGWGRDERVQGSLSPGGSPVAQDRRRMTTARTVNNDPPEWLNIHTKDCPLLRPVFEAMTSPSNITIPELTVTRNTFAQPIQQIQPETSQQAPAQRSAPNSADGRALTLGAYAVEAQRSQPETSQQAPAQRPVPTSADGAALTLGAYAVEAPPQGTAASLTSAPNPDNLPVLSSGLSESLGQIRCNSDRVSLLTPPTQPPAFTRTNPQQYSILPAQRAPSHPTPPYQADQAAIEQQRQPQNMILPAQWAPNRPKPPYQAYQNPLTDIQQLMNYARNYQQSWHYIIGLYIQWIRDPSTFQVAPHLWEKDAWKADMLQKNPSSVLIWPDPARGTIEYNLMEELRGSELKRQTMEAAIVEWSHSCQPREVINVMHRAGWTRRSEYVFGANWTTMDTIKKMDEGPEKISLLAKAERESPRFFRKCMEDEMCGSVRKRKLEHSLPTARQLHRDNPNSRQQKRQVEEKGPFGSGRLRRERQRKTPTVSGIDEVVEVVMSEFQQKKKHAEWKKFLAAKDGTYVHPQLKHEKPAQVILHGYTPNNRDKAVAAYESISKGMICEDYHRDPKRCKYPSVANPHRKRPLTVQERLLSRYQGGNCWIRVTFDTKNAAQHAIRQSPHRIGNHLVFAYIYNGLGPREDVSIPWQGNGTSSNQGCGCV